MHIRYDFDMRLLEDAFCLVCCFVERRRSTFEFSAMSVVAKFFRRKCDLFFGVLERPITQNVWAWMSPA